MHIRKMTREDAEAVYAISCACFSQPWSREDILKEMENKAASYFIAEEDEIIGYAGMWHMADEAEIMNIAVDARNRKKQAGSRLLEALLREAENLAVQNVYLEVRDSNQAAKALYHKYGFTETGRRKNYYHHPTEDAVNMKCEL